MKIESKHRGKVAVMPCTGIGQVLGTITRQAAYRVCEALRPQQTRLLCLPALVRGVQEDIDMIENGPVLLIEGCQDRCAAAALTTPKGIAAETIYLPDVLKQMGISVTDAHRSALTPDEWRVVDRLAERTAQAVDRLYTSSTGNRT